VEEGSGVDHPIGGRGRGGKDTGCEKKSRGGTPIEPPGVGETTRSRSPGRQS
jgi:hypothetical protein